MIAAKPGATEYGTLEVIVGDWCGDNHKCEFCGDELPALQHAEQRCVGFFLVCDGDRHGPVCDACVQSGADGIRHRAMEAAKERLSVAQKQLEHAQYLQHAEIVLPELLSVINETGTEFARLCQIAGCPPEETFRENNIPF